MPLQPGDLYFANMFNDATRILEGGLWHNIAEEAGQGHGTDLRYINDLQIVQSGLQGFVAAGDFTGAQLRHVNRVLTDITTALNNVQGAVDGVANAEHDLRTAHLDIIATIQNDPVLLQASLALDTANPGFNPAPPMMDHPVNANTPHATFAQLGVIYDDAQSRMLAGPDSTNNGATKIQQDLTIVHDGLVALMAAHPTLFGGLIGVHAQTIVDQLALQTQIYDGQYGFNIDAGRATNDNLLDIDDIVAGDTFLTNLSHQGGFNGWTPAPATDVMTPRYQDNAAQTNFWADFIASGHVLGNHGVQLADHGDAGAIASFETVLNGWLKNVNDFDAAQGGIFQARFDNELLGNLGTVGADVMKMIEALNTHNVTLANAAAEGMVANAADVSGNNIPVNGGSYVDGVTIADVLANTIAPPPPTTFLTPGQTPPAAVAVAATVLPESMAVVADVSVDQPHHHHHHHWNHVA